MALKIGAAVKAIGWAYGLAIHSVIVGIAAGTVVASYRFNDGLFALHCFVAMIQLTVNGFYAWVAFSKLRK